MNACEHIPQLKRANAISHVFSVESNMDSDSDSDDTVLDDEPDCAELCDPNNSAEQSERLGKSTMTQFQTWVFKLLAPKRSKLPLLPGAQSCYFTPIDALENTADDGVDDISDTTSTASVSRKCVTFANPMVTLTVPADRTFGLDARSWFTLKTNTSVRAEMLGFGAWLISYILDRNELGRAGNWLIYPSSDSEPASM